MLRQFATTLEFETAGRGLVDITPPVRRWVEPHGVACGALTLFVRHTSASLLVQENADPDVRRDLETFMAGLAPDGDPRFVHTAEGPDDMPAHVRSMLTASDLTIPIRNGDLALGTWQSICLVDLNVDNHDRTVRLDFLAG